MRDRIPIFRSDFDQNNKNTFFFKKKINVTWI